MDRKKTILSKGFEDYKIAILKNSDSKNEYKYIYISNPRKGSFHDLGFDFLLLRLIEQEIGQYKRVTKSKYEVIHQGYSDLPLIKSSTNTISYLAKDEINSHLICYNIPEDIVDTVISIRNDTAFNVVQEIERNRNQWIYLAADSILITNTDQQNVKMYQFYRLKDENNLELFHELESHANLSVCKDFSQVYIDIPKDNYFRSWPFYRILIYDVEINEFFELGSADINFGYYSPKRLSRSDYLYFIKCMNKENEIWRVNNDGEQECIYKPECKECNIYGYYLFKDKLHIFTESFYKGDISKKTVSVELESKNK